MNTHHLRIKHSKKYPNELFTRIPVGYLRWMVQSGHDEADVARSELERRGTVVPEIDVSGHAIDSASKRLLGYWTSTRNKDEGLHAWLCRMALDAYNSGVLDEAGSIVYNGIKWVYCTGEWPVLKTVMLKGEKINNTKRE